MSNPAAWGVENLDVILTAWNMAERAEKRRCRRSHCGARRRDGGTCNAHPVPWKNRCRLHGGLSTGPTTEAGKKAIIASNQRRAQTRREQQEEQLRQEWERQRQELVSRVKAGLDAIIAEHRKPAVPMASTGAAGSVPANGDQR